MSQPILTGNGTSSGPNSLRDQVRGRIQDYTSGLALTSLASASRAVEMMHVSALISSIPYRYYGTWWNAPIGMYILVGNDEGYQNQV